MQASSFGSYYLAPLGEQLNKDGRNAWFGNGYVGLYSTPEYSPDTFIGDTQKFVDENRESIKEAAEFEVIFDDQKYLEEILAEALKSGLITGFTKSPEYYQAAASYLWDEYGHGLEEGKERHTKINTDNIVVLRFIVAEQDKDRVFHFINEKMSQKWDTPLIKVVEKGVNKKFADYLAQNVAHEKPEGK